MKEFGIIKHTSWVPVLYTGMNTLCTVLNSRVSFWRKDLPTDYINNIDITQNLTTPLFNNDIVSTKSVRSFSFEKRTKISVTDRRAFR